MMGPASIRGGGDSHSVDGFLHKLPNPHARLQSEDRFGASRQPVPIGAEFEAETRAIHLEYN